MGDNAPTSIADCLKLAANLTDVSDSPRLDVELLLSHTLQQPRSFLYTWPQRTLEQEQLTAFQALVRRRKQGEPIAYLIGVKEFWSLPLAVNASTLIPRPETELLVETVLELLPASDETTFSILDLGTGSGAIALAIAHERPQWRVVAVDKHSDAISLALSNKERLGISNIDIFQSDWFGELRDETFDIIVTNPPYIDVKDPHLQQGDVRFEPHTALVSADHGYSDIKHLADHSRNFLRSGGWFVAEHGFQQAAIARDFFSVLGYRSITTRQDLNGNDRLTLGQYFAT